MSAAERVFSVLLRAYPAEFRAAYGTEMTVVFRDYHREKGAHPVRFWSEIIWDVARSAPELRLDVARARWRGLNTTGEGMKMTTAMAVLAMLIGAVEVVNSGVEGWLGGVVNRGGYSLLAGTLGMVAGSLLLMAGVALLRRTTGAATIATRAAIACLAVFLLTGVVVPRMSIFATMLGIAFPIALLVFVRLRGRGQSAPTVA